MKPKQITIRKWGSIDFEAFQAELRAVCWSPVLHEFNPDEGWWSWTSTVLPIIDRHAPLATVTIKHKSGFGISFPTRNLIRLATAQLRIYRRSGASDDFALYKCMRRQVRAAIALERRQKFESGIAINRSSRDTWNMINTTLGKSKVSQRLDVNTARSFNDYFCSVGTDIQASVIATTTPNDTFFGPPKSFID